MKRLTVVSVSATFFLVMALISAILPANLGADQPAELESAISFGQTVSGTIAVPGETDTYTFAANSGDLILIGMSRVSGDLWQRIRLYGPGGKLLRDERSPVHVEIAPVLPDRYLVYLPLMANRHAGKTGGNTMALDSRTQPTVPGTYTIAVGDGFDGTKTGSYNLYIQRLNEPSGATGVSFSQTASGTINQPAEMDTFSFTANAGDTILLSMSRLSGDLWQQLRLYDPDGNLLNEQSDPVHTELTSSVPATGEYTILVADGFNGTLTGAYSLFIQRLNDPANALSLSFGQIVPGTIQQPAEMDTFTVDADGGDTIFFGMSRISGDLWQEIRLYGPHGTLLSEVSSPVHVELTYTVATSGDYRILVTDGFDGTNTGSYNLYVQRLNNPSGATSLPVGQTVAGSILQPGEVDTYRFGAQVNDTFRIQMTRVSGTLWQQIRLYDPDGNLIGDNEGVAQAEMTRSLPVTGEYTVLASDGFDGTLTGSYTIGLEQLP